ncbi:MAG: hypothetical protein GWN37_00820, partial [Gammaproteobacteria bacterium]|nr:hypothetical protein [Gammaproteobacteria bacterium]
PLLVLVGERDFAGAGADARAFARVLRDAGHTRNRIEEMPGRHQFTMAELRGAGNPVLATITDF